MTDESDDTRQPKSGGDDNPTRKPLADHPTLRIVVIAVSLLAAIVGVAAGVITIIKFVTDSPEVRAGDVTSAVSSSQTVSAATDVSTPQSPRTTGQTTDDTATPTPSANSATSSGPTPLAVGTCLSGELTEADCDAPHRFEVIVKDSSPCDVKAGVAYLGGDIAVDVIRANVAVKESDAFHRSCMIYSAEDADRSTSVRGILSGLAGDSFRWCRDDRTAPTDVGCDTAHTHEFVGGIAGEILDQPQCDDAASNYMHRSTRQVSDRLAVTALPDAKQADGQARCVISVRGNEVLTASVRNVRANALPLASQ